ncbi:hypothetical protein HSRCO_1141 [Halanaeroarchaeum sp. HSR-CO]|uniref:hypothetical protein n=1 Tax=Halanaeroarchaeum sp. HSR-CO TaxID=2866382 RepID=UPI00217EB8FD|nr:hypothetical protein [Halanaeroarchaeum sp. HSR-CO]UWG47428.1 hypothetical protein HSRCO_1141 [Halanaeroarchaeum sp. HSR-CO]
MDKDINDVTEVFRSVRDHDYNELRNDIGGLLARVRAMSDAVDDVRELEDEIQEVEWALLPQGDEEHMMREDLLIDILKIVDDGYLSSAWALRETLESLIIDHAPESDSSESLYEQYKDDSQTVIGLRIYSHHGNRLPVRIIDDGFGGNIGSGDGVRRKIGVLVDDVREKKGEKYRQSPDQFYEHLELNFIHLPELMRNHFEMAEVLVNEFVEVVLQENSETVQDYQSVGAELKSLLDSGAHNRY